MSLLLKYEGNEVRRVKRNEVAAETARNQHRTLRFGLYLRGKKCFVRLERQVVNYT